MVNTLTMDPRKAKQILDKYDKPIPPGKERSKKAFTKMNQKKFNDEQRRLKFAELFKKANDDES